MKTIYVLNEKEFSNGQMTHSGIIGAYEKKEDAYAEMKNQHDNWQDDGTRELNDTSAAMGTRAYRVMLVIKSIELK